MEVKKSQVFRQIMDIFKRSGISQDAILNKSLLQLANNNATTLNVGQINDVVNIIDLVQEYSRVSYMIAITESVCSFLSSSQTIVEDVDLYDTKQLKLILNSVSCEEFI